MSGRETGLRIDANAADSMQVDGETVVLSLATHDYFGLNATGTTIWELIKAHPGIDRSTLAAALAAHFPAADAAVGDDVERLVEQLVERRLVSEVAASPVSTPTAVRAAQPYVVPQLEAFGALDTLILSGE